MTASVSMGAVVDRKFEKKITNLAPFGSQIWASPAIDGVMFQDILLKNRNTKEAWVDANEKMQGVVDKFRQSNPSWKPEII